MPKPPIPVQHERFFLINYEAGSQRDDFARDIASGLTSTPKHLSCRFLYDHEGSRLFEKICDLPEYYPTRVERAILQERAGEIAGVFDGNVSLIELGSGNAAKTRILIEEFLRRHGTLRYIPVDISGGILEESSKELLNDYPALEITAIAGEYHDALPHLNGESKNAKLILWLGSNIGNLDRPEAASFLRLVGSAMAHQDRFLVGIDLRKDHAVLERAYDDAAGVTAAFSRNILVRINREFGGHFDLRRFRHQAIYNEAAGRIEIYLVSTQEQTVRIDDLKLDVAFAKDERIHTENSYKYSPAEIKSLAAAAGLIVERQWSDSQCLFSLNLLAAGPQLD